jgi:hypothetical protein
MQAMSTYIHVSGDFKWSFSENHHFKNKDFLFSSQNTSKHTTPSLQGIIFYSRGNKNKLRVCMRERREREHRVGGRIKFSLYSNFELKAKENKQSGEAAEMLLARNNNNP